MVGGRHFEGEAVTRRGGRRGTVTQLLHTHARTHARTHAPSVVEAGERSLEARDLWKEILLRHKHVVHHNLALGMRREREREKTPEEGSERM